MQLNAEHISVLIILANIIISYQGFNKLTFRDRYIFDVDSILIGKEYIRLISSGFLHSGWWHLLFNMYTLYIFSSALAFPVLGLSVFPYLLIYFGSLLGGNLLALYVHKNHGDYRALGASGAVSGVMFASIIIFPGMKLSLIYPPIPMPGWVFAVAFVLISLYGIKSRLGNIGHEAHLGGAITGMLIGILFKPSALVEQPVLIAAILLPTIVFLYILVKKPEVILIPGYLKNRVKDFSPKMEVRRNTDTKGGHKSDFNSKEEELDFYLDKVNKKGMESLSSKEKKRLKELSEELDEG